MIYLEIAILFGCIIYAAKLGGVGVGMAGGLGMAIAVFGLGLKPGEIPVDVILIILTVIFAISCMQLAGGMDYMVKISARLLRGNPKYINFLAPAITFLLTVLGGTGFTAMSVLNVIQEVAKENGVRPSQPLTSAVIASQIAITASFLFLQLPQLCTLWLKKWVFLSVKLLPLSFRRLSPAPRSRHHLKLPRC